ALVAEDSITASIFLARLLEQRGFLVRTVERAAEMHAELARDDWALVCVDVELPDARGRSHLVAVRDALERSAGPSGPPVLVALARDREDDAEAEAAGISRVLRKPFDREALGRLLDRAGLDARERA
ncbi:MAG TPA: response regulator, partial [Candidatus Eisenbacteria bacterium]